MWDVEQYQKYAKERSRPFLDLLARVSREDAKFIADLGCGAGNLTRILAERWPAAQVVGIDHAAEMLAQAKAQALPSRLEFMQADISSWAPEMPLDLIVSNAALQWVENHEALLARMAGWLSAPGTLAVQMPYHFQDPAHLAIEETKADPRWRTTLQGVGLHQESVRPLEWYLERLHDLGFVVDAWQTIYLHVLSGENPVLEWFKGTALRPMLSRLAPPTDEEFLHELGRRFQTAFPARGTVTLLPLPRLFFVATRQG